MRSTLLVLLLLAAVGGGAWILLGEDVLEVSDRLDSWKTEDERAGGPDDAASHASDGLMADAVPLIGVWGEGPAIPARDLQFGEVMANLVRFPEEGGKLTGALLLASIGEAVGETMPIRFSSRASLERFQAADLPMAAPKEVDLPQALDWMREIGFAWEEREGYLLVRPSRKP